MPSRQYSVLLLRETIFSSLANCSPLDFNPIDGTALRQFDSFTEVPPSFIPSHLLFQMIYYLVVTGSEERSM